MGYFSSLARQSGIPPLQNGIPAAHALRGLEVEVTRVAGPEVPAADAESPSVQPAPPPKVVVPAPTPVAQNEAGTPGVAPPGSYQVVEVAVRSRRPAPEPTVEAENAVPARDQPAGTPGVALPRPYQVVEVTVPPRPAAPKPTVEAENAVPAREQTAEGAVNQRTDDIAESSPPTEPAASAVRVGQAEVPSPLIERRRPTFAEVCAWVAQPLLDISETQAVTPPRPRPEPQPIVSELPSSTDAATNYTLEIGTIQIVIDEPAAAAPSRQARPAPPAPASNHPSRYYLR